MIQIKYEDNSYFAFPVVGNYDGDGQADAAVFRQLNSTWYLQQSTNGFTAVGFGIDGDKPVPSAYIP